MRRIAIVGGGQSGLQLGFGLLRQGYDVTVFTDREADQVATGRVMSAQCMFDSSVQLERALGLDLWLEQTPPITSLRMTHVGAEGVTVASWRGRFDHPARSVDQRMKIAAWMRMFVADGGDLRVREVALADLDDIAASHDLVVVATGPGPISNIFPIDPARTVYGSPRRSLALTYVKTPADSYAGEMRFYRIDGVGEYYRLPALTAHGRCEVMMIERLPGGPLDSWAEAVGAQDHLARVRDLLDTYLPDEAAYFGGDLELTDPGGYLEGRFAPWVREPVGYTVGGRPLLALADAAVLNDPIAAQGANNAAKSADVYLRAVVERGTEPFDVDWMTETFERYWQGYGEWATQWTNSLLDLASSPGERILEAAASSPSLAGFVVNGFDDPRTLFPAWSSAERADELIARAAEADQGGAADSRELRRAFGQFATGVVVVTARTVDGRRVGVTVNSFTSVSLDPPLVLWCLADSSGNLDSFTRAERFNVHVLAADQHHLSRRFSSPHADKFAGLPDDDPQSTPRLAGVAARFECRNVRRHHEGDHVVFVGEVVGFEEFDTPPLVFHSGSYHVATRHPDIPS